MPVVMISDDPNVYDIYVSSHLEIIGVHHLVGYREIWECDSGRAGHDHGWVPEILLA